LSTLPGDHVTLTVGDSIIPAQIAGQGGDNDETGHGLFGGVYYLPVPADLTAATLKITPGTVSAEDSYLGHPIEVTTAGSVTLPLSFPAVSEPPPPAPSPPPQAAASSASAPRTGSASPPGHRGGGLPAGLIAAIAAAVALAAVGVTLAVRGRRPTVAVAAGPASGRGGGPQPEAPLPPGSETSPARTAPTAVTSPADSPSRLLVPPAGPPPLAEGTVEVQVLGTPRVVGRPDGQPAPGQSAVELLAFLALHPAQAFTGEQLRAALGVGRERELDADTVRRYANALRRALGDGRVPEARAAGGYQVRDVSTDAARLRALVRQADGVAPGDAARHLADALALVRAAPFAEVPAGSYGWADTTPIASDLAVSIQHAAVSLGRLALDARDPDLARWAVERGLVVWPTDETLHTIALTAAAGSPDPTRLAQTWARLAAMYGAHREAIPDPLVRLYHGLRASS
jgi:hypothetical protein